MHGWKYRYCYIIYAARTMSVQYSARATPQVFRACIPPDTRRRRLTVSDVRKKISQKRPSAPSAACRGSTAKILSPLSQNYATRADISLRLNKLRAPSITGSSKAGNPLCLFSEMKRSEEHTSEL